jgi:hypothetical protein
VQKVQEVLLAMGEFHDDACPIYFRLIQEKSRRMRKLGRPTY